MTQSLLVLCIVVVMAFCIFSIIAFINYKDLRDIEKGRTGKKRQIYR